MKDRQASRMVREVLARLRREVETESLPVGRRCVMTRGNMSAIRDMSMGLGESWGMTERWGEVGR